jgi:hypothetical protein
MFWSTWNQPGRWRWRVRGRLREEKGERYREEKREKREEWMKSKKRQERRDRGSLCLFSHLHSSSPKHSLFLFLFFFSVFLPAFVLVCGRNAPAASRDTNSSLVPHIWAKASWRRGRSRSAHIISEWQSSGRIPVVLRPGQPRASSHVLESVLKIFRSGHEYFTNILLMVFEYPPFGNGLNVGPKEIVCTSDICGRGDIGKNHKSILF